MTAPLTKWFVGLVAVAVICCGQEKDPALAKKEAAIREMLALTDAKKIGDQMFQSMRAAMTSEMPDEFDTAFEEFAKEINWSELTELMVPIYAKHFTQEEIDAIVVFYKSPAGRKMMESLPVIMQEYMPAAMEWSRKAQRFRQKLESK